MASSLVPDDGSTTTTPSPSSIKRVSDAIVEPENRGGPKKYWKRFHGLKNGTNENLIPKIIHQSWKDRNVPDRFHDWPETWKEKNPEWEYKLWTNEDNRRLVEDKFPWFLETYLSMPKEIMRADVARYLYMYEYGGLYADLDMECIKPISLLLSRFPTATVFVGRMNSKAHFDDNVPNAFMISRKGHPVWLWILRFVERKAKKTQNVDRHRNRVESISGPVPFKFGIEAFMRHGEAGPDLDKGVMILDSEYIYPVDWSSTFNAHPYCQSLMSEFDAEKCKIALNVNDDPSSNSFAITYWSQSWGSQ
ncbi:hypothetical protein HDU76_013282 [Blyttiomyces sp. JEL0837]|nr:hypothetical protein HDU76_013282 [Blyttiomyces sp. JEL0837]